MFAFVYFCIFVTSAHRFPSSIFALRYFSYALTPSAPFFDIFVRFVMFFALHSIPGKETALPGTETTLQGKETTLPGKETTFPGKEATLPGKEITKLFISQRIGRLFQN